MDKEALRKLVQGVTAEWTDKGKVIEGGWQSYVVLNGLSTAPADRLRELRKVFFCGAQHLFGSIMTVMDDGAEPTEKDFQRMELIHRELEEFRASLSH